MKNQLLFILSLMILLVQYSCKNEQQLSEQPNILWITCEDINPFLGAYGDQQAITPNLDQLAKEGVVYTNAYATAPVCSPSRSCLITGVYATSLGTQHLRSTVKIPESIIPYPVYLREAGYYCSNSGKEDYNFKTGDIWDETSDEAHWRNRKPGQPFFSVFNIHTTHQSQIFGSDEAYEEKYGRLLPETTKHQPESMVVPPYHFDAPEVRKLWARYYNQITLMDQHVGEILKELEEDGLTENTIIFYYSDHGTGMPRSKRALYDSGLRVPLIIKAPKKYQKQLALPAGTINEEPVHFVDFAPTVFSLLGIDIPNHMQGIAFLGDKKQTQEYVFGHSDRVDEAYEMSRTVRGKRYRYIRNYLPHLALIQPNFYTDQSEIMKALRRIKDLGNLTEAQQSMWLETRTVEELFDTEQDPYEVNNLAGLPEYQEVLFTMRKAQKDWAIRTKDSGLLHEIDMHRIGKESTIYEALQKRDNFPIQKMLTAMDVLFQQEVTSEKVLPLLKAKEPALRFWAAIMLQTHRLNDNSIMEALGQLLSDPHPSVRLTAAQSLCNLGDCKAALKTVRSGLTNDDKMVRLYAARIFEELGEKAETLTADVIALKDKMCPVEWSQYYELYTCWALEEALKQKEVQ